MSIRNIYEYLKCDGVSVDILDKNSRNKSDKSILLKNKEAIDEYIKKNGCNITDNYFKYEIDKINQIFINFNKNEKNEKIKVYNFCKKIIFKKSEINIMQKKIDIFVKFNKTIYQNIYLNYDKSLIIYNPINYNIHHLLINDSINFSDNNIKITLDILTQGNIINLSLPSIGLLKCNMSPKTCQNYTTFIYQIINSNNLNNTLFDYIPLKEINIGDTISNFLVNIKLDNEKNNLNNDNTDNTEDLIRKILNIKMIDFNEIFYISKNKDKNKNKKVRIEYLIPYEITDKNILKIMEKSKITTFKDIDIIHQHNKTLLMFIIKNNDDNLLLRKEVLACFLFYIINIVYDISKKYLNTIDNIIKQIINSKDKRFKRLNIVDAYKYTTDLNKSLMNFKIILLNNFYQIFIPSKLTKLYGMIYDINGCYIPDKDSIFTIDNKTFNSNYPFKDPINEINISNFLLNILEKNDVYEPERVLELGGFIYTTHYMKKSSELLCEKYLYYDKYNKFILVIMSYFIDFFKNKNIPFNILPPINNIIRQSNTIIKNKLIKDYKEYLEDATNYYKKLIDIREKIKLIKYINNNLSNLEEIYLMCFNINLTLGLCYDKIVSKQIFNVDLKKEILTQYFEIKKFNENIILKYLDK